MSQSGKAWLVASLVGVAWAAPAAAQTFPATSAFVPLPCGTGVMIDAAGDTPNATGPLDLVGTPSLPAGAHAADPNFLYLRLRVAGDPMANGALVPNAWGYEIDLDGNRNTYELIISVSGVGANDEVAIYRHTTVTAGNPAEPATTPAAFTYPASTNARVTSAGSTLGGGQDFFIDFAVPWSDLAAAGLVRNMTARLWAGSSTVPNALDLDLACFGGAGGTLGGIDVGPTTPDPQAGGGGAGGGGGGGAGGSGVRTLEGGPGCSVAGSSVASSCAGAGILLIVALALLARRRNRSSLL